MPVFDQLQRASFDGLDFPIRSVHIRGTYRKHTHEYLRVDGGINEKLKRGLYKIEMEAEFHATIRGYGKLWPDVLAAIRGKYEQGITSELVIPTVGAIRAFQEEWDQSADMGRIRSGERVRLQFIEDQTETFLAQALVGADTSSVASSASHLAEIREGLEESEASKSLFDSIQDLSNSIFAFKDQSELYGGLMSAKVAQLTAIAEEADRDLEDLQDPENFELLYALHEVWDAAITLARNLVESPRGPRLYVVPRVMSVSDISTALYGSTARASELMINNDLEDPFAVPAGTKIVWFP